MIRCGKGAAVMAPGVKRLAMTFPYKNTDGCMGPRLVSIVPRDLY